MPASLAPLVREIAPGHHTGGRGIHGMTHWARVLENGLRVGEPAGANLTVVRLFAVFHDARRINDRRDPGHGERGAMLARAMRAKWLDLTDEAMEQLEFACAHHTDGTISPDATIQACWDADRLDLPRVGISINPKFLSPAAGALATIAWAHERATRPHRPDFLSAWRSPDITAPVTGFR